MRSSVFFSELQENLQYAIENDTILIVDSSLGGGVGFPKELIETYQERMRLLSASGAGPVNLLILRLQQRQPPATVSPTCERRRSRPAMMDRETVWFGGM